MNCQNVRSAIDTATRRAPVAESVKAHLSGCRDCRNHSDKTGSLLALLSAQPRVEAPADFNFKLRARLASAEAESRTSWAAVERFWARSFSWGQALTATATLALLATFTALHFTSSDRPAVTAPDRMESANVAVTTQKPDPVAPVSVQEPTSVREAAVSDAKPAAVRLSVRSARVSPASYKSVEVATPKVQVAGGGYEPWRGYNPEKGNFVSAPTRDLIGAEGQNSRVVKTAAFVPSI